MNPAVSFLNSNKHTSHLSIRHEAQKKDCYNDKRVAQPYFCCNSYS